MIKKSKKLMTSLLLALSLIAVFPISNAFALTKEEEDKQYYDFITNKCTQTTWDKNVYEKDGKYYLMGYGSTEGWKPNGLYGFDIYANSDGILQKNMWHQDVNGSWHYYGSDYKNVIGYQTIDGKYYYFAPNGIFGILETGWQKRAADGGEPSKDWKERLANSRWYYYGEDGVIKEGWVNSGGKWYYIYSNGLMAIDTTTPDGYHVDKNGVWTS